MSTATHDYAAIAEQEALLQERERQIRHLERELAARDSRLSRLSMQARSIQTLTLSLFGVLDATQIYALVCESLVVQLGYSSAMVFAIRSRRAAILGSSHVTQGQLGHVSDYLGQEPYVLEAYSHKNALTTLRTHDKAALSLRALFQTDEVIAMPILFGERLFGYLAVCLHGQAATRHANDDVEFLASLAGQLGHAVQNASSFKDLEAQNVRLRQLDELKDSFISITSHQLRTPLSIVKWILSILQTDPALASLDEQSKLVDQAYESNERLIHVVNDLLNVSRIQEGKLPYNPQPADLHGLVFELCESSRRLCEAHSLRLETELAKDLPGLELDPILFREAIQNLIDNAVDYNQAGGYVRVRLWLADSRITISVTNSGMGVSPEVRAKIFDQFYRAPEAVRAHPNGNGLGLYLARAIVEQHGGTIEMASQPGEETTLTVALPIP
jgi:signal transduction histidine kinase